VNIFKELKLINHYKNDDLSEFKKDLDGEFNLVFKGGDTLLMKSIFYQSTSIFDFIMENKPDLLAKNELGVSAVFGSMPNNLYFYEKLIKNKEVLKSTQNGVGLFEYGVSCCSSDHFLSVIDVEKIKEPMLSNYCSSFLNQEKLEIKDHKETFSRLSCLINKEFNKESVFFSFIERDENLDEVLMKMKYDRRKRNKNGDSVSDLMRKNYQLKSLIENYELKKTLNETESSLNLGL